MRLTMLEWHSELNRTLMESKAMESKPIFRVDWGFPCVALPFRDWQELEVSG